MNDAPIQREIIAGERLIWTGQPRQGLRPTFEEQGGVNFAVAGFFVFWLVMVASITLDNLWDVEGRFNLRVLIAGLVFFAFGSALLDFVAGYDAVDRQHTFYGLTDQRIILISGILRPNLRSFLLHDLQRTEVEVQDNGSGTISFKDVSYTWRGASIVPSFAKIENVEWIHDLVRRAKEQPQRARADAS
jgi:hypothetical protein